MIHRRYVTLSEKLTAKDLDVTVSHFIQYLEGRSLLVIEQTPDEVTVIDDTDTKHILKRGEFIITQGRREVRA